MESGGQDQEPAIIAERTSHQSGANRNTVDVIAQCGNRARFGQMPASDINGAERSAPANGADTKPKGGGFVEENQMRRKQSEPDTRDLPRTEREKTGESREKVEGVTNKALGSLTGPQKEEPAGAGESKGKTIGATRDVIDRGAVDRMHDPDERDEKRNICI